MTNFSNTTEPTLTQYSAQNTSLRYQDILQVVKDDFAHMDELIAGRVGSKVRLVMAVSNHVIHAGGKRMRPLMGLLAGRICVDVSSEDAMRLSAITEMLHTATLVHDDVIDESHLRRGQATANATWDNPTAVLVGDYLIARAFNLLVEFKDLELLQLFSDGTCDIAEGEVLQLEHQHNPAASEQDYLDIIYGKTSRLFMLATQGMCLLFDKPEYFDAFGTFSRHFGNAFQIIDDVLDYVADSKELGKNIGDDIAEGKPTLPMIAALKETKTARPDDHHTLRVAVQTGKTPDIDHIVGLVKSTSAINYCRGRAFEETKAALAALDALPTSRYKQALVDLTNFALARIA